MKCTLMVTGLACLLLLQGSLSAQPREGRGEPGEGGPPQHPLLMLLDENKDGEISQKEMENAVAALKKLDQNSDGKLTRNELPRPFGGMPGGPGGPGGPPREDMMARLKSMDKDGDGKISKEEAPERMQQNFANLDTNSDGYLDRAEIRQMAERMGGPGGEGRGPDGPEGDRGNLLERLPNLDTNKDGKISKEEAPERLQGIFERLDDNSDGFLDKEELRGAGERLRERFRERREEKKSKD